METTLEVRWFVRGMPPAVVQRWFKLDCPGELLAEEPETREDLYACRTPEDIKKFSAIASNIINPIAINLKLREGNLELKLRQYKLRKQRFGNLKNSAIWWGNIEQWYKLTERELKDSGLSVPHLIPQTNWISVYKKRKQRIEAEVKRELTWLRSDRDCWWSVAFEMTKNSHDRERNNYFKKVIDRACQTYYGPKLSADNSYSYSRWLLELYPPTVFDSKYNIERSHSIHIL